MRLGGLFLFVVFVPFFFNVCSMPGPDDSGAVSSGVSSLPPPADQGQPPSSEQMAQQPAASPEVEKEKAAVATPSPSSVDLKATSLKWPDALELKEEQSGSLSNSDPAIVQVYNDSENALNEIAKSVQEISKMRDDLFSKLSDISNKVDDFFQEAAIQKGRLTGASEDLVVK